MNNTISVYDLLGLIKEGKAPKKIKYKDNNYIFTGYDYHCILTNIEKEFVEYRLIKNYIQDLQSTLNDKVEILENKKEELELLSWQQIGYLDRTLEEIVKDINTQNRKTNGKINEIIKYLKDKEDKNN